MRRTRWGNTLVSMHPHHWREHHTPTNSKTRHNEQDTKGTGPGRDGPADYSPPRPLGSELENLGTGN